MSESRAAIRYAKAVLDLAVERKAADEVEKDMRSIASTIQENVDLQQLLDSPVVKAEIKKSSLNQIFKGSNEISLGLISTLVANKRIGMLHHVAQKYILRYEKMKGEGVAYVTTAVPMTADLEKKILAQVKKMTDNKITLESKIDEGIVGGFILRVGDLQYDASVTNKLNKLKREFTNSL